LILSISKGELYVLYSKAEANYYECINNKGNEFLQEELPVPIESIELKHSSVKVVFTQEDVSCYNLEIILSLWIDTTKSIGKYWYIEDDKGNAVDDGLVFY
jgi:hypothetical protein